jgi:branched-subunit amino acid transport protein AzlD
MQTQAVLFKVTPVLPFMVLQEMQLDPEMIEVVGLQMQA